MNFVKLGEPLAICQLKRLTEHKYSASGVSLFEPQLQRFWKWLVLQIPLTWAPNAITLTGLIINVVTTLLLVLYSPNAQHETPWWTHVSCAIGLLIYQSLDAIDGKQARRTGSSSPLGELFDHGCDAVSTVFVVIGVVISTGLGVDPFWLFVECFVTMFLFYTAHWQTYVSGTMHFGIIDVTEAQFSVMLIYMCSAMFGLDFWQYTLPVLNIQMKAVPIGMSLMTAALAFKNYFSSIFVEGGIGKNGSTVAGTSVLSPLFPISIVMILAIVIWQKSTTQLFETHPILYTLSFGIVSSKITNKLVVAHMTKSEMELLDSILIGPLLLFVNQYFNTFINEYCVLWMCFIYCLFDLVHYSSAVCVQICDYLNICCFTIPPPGATTIKSPNSTNHNLSKSYRDTPTSTSRPLTRSAAKLFDKSH